MMNTGKRIKTLILAFAVAASMLVPQVSFASVTAKDEEGLPDQPGASAALWKKSFGSTSGETWKNAPTPPAYINGSIYVAAGNRVYKLNAKTGEQEAASDTLGTAPAFGYAT
ncbi:MAG: hypothetical protein VZQ84_01935, partial [Anaerovoracaceae bacterium]|nr:hypothetical protein [Anaerovoracaceae bacterium]